MSSYKDSGVDVDKGDEFVSDITPLVQKTFNDNVLNSLGGFASLYNVSWLKNYNTPVIVSATDGVGTKVEVARALNKFDTIGIDLVAMVVNDIVAHGAKPFLFLDYYASGKLDKKQATEVLQGIITGCNIAGCSLVGGETAEMPGVYQNQTFDLAGFGVGAVEYSEILPKKDEILRGDWLVGLPSSGFHSNGYSLIRKIFADKNLPLTEDLLTPTKIYVNECLATRHIVKGFAHITGGGFSNIRRILPNHLRPMMNSIKFSGIFEIIQRYGNLTAWDMYTTFNCGYGMVAVVDRERIDEFRNIAPMSIVIGEVQ
ncbi:MAG: phosphoribosylformylglycinamidine cyclo-ligase [Richelia sp. RM2_1_2]|nr:phosphoribosylformylglycinamidine cyclo-ligase [Richelia sp. RM2_1_2]